MKIIIKNKHYIREIACFFCFVILSINTTLSVAADRYLAEDEIFLN